MLKVSVLNTLDGCNSLRPRWNELVHSMDYPSPFVSPAWVIAAFKIHEDKWIPYIVLVRSGDRLIGIFPMYEAKGNRLRTLRFAGDCYYPDPLGLCCKAGDREDCIGAIMNHFKRSRDWDVLRLQWLLPEEALEWGKSGAIIRKSSVAPYIPLPETFQDYLKEFKKKINFAIRKVKKFDKLNGGYSSTKSPEKCRDILGRLFNLHEKRSLERGIQSSFSGSDIVDFHTSLNDSCKKLYFHWLTVDDEIIAVLYGFLLQNRFFYYQISHDPKMGALSPGAVLLYKAIEECCANGVKEFNFLQGNEGYKWKWTRSSKTLYTVEMYNYTVSGFTSRLKDNVRLFIKSLVKTIN